MIGTLDIKVNAAHPNMPLSPVYTFLGSPQQVRIINVPKQIGNWKITAVQVTVNYPDNSSPSVEATLVGGCWSATLPAPSAVGQSLMGFKVTASGTDEHGDAITGYVLGKGDAYVLDDDATITVGGTTYYVHMVDAVPESPRKGDLAVIDNIYQLYDGSRWHPLGNQATISWSDITGKPTAFPPEDHTHVKSEITDFPTAMPPTAHSHATDNWFTSAIETVKGWATNAFAALIHSHATDDWFTTEIGSVESWVSGNFCRIDDIQNPSESAESMHPADAKATYEALSGKANKSDFTLGSFAYYVSALFSTANTANNLDNIRTSASDATSSAVTIEGKRGKNDFVIVPETKIKDEYLPISGGVYDWSSHRLEKQDDGSYYLWGADDEDVYAAIFSAEGILTGADPDVSFNGAHVYELGGVKLLDIADNIARESQLRVKADKTELTSKANLTDLPYNYRTISVPASGWSTVSATDGAIIRIYSSGYTYLNINPTVTLPVPAINKTAECVLRWNTGSTVHSPAPALPTGKTVQSFSISGDTPEANAKYEMFVQIVPTATANTYEVISVTRKLA